VRIENYAHLSAFATLPGRELHVGGLATLGITGFKVELVLDREFPLLTVAALKPC
jgi:hypothetical protein